jgi:hypothetical protein
LQQRHVECLVLFGMNTAVFNGITGIWGMIRGIEKMKEWRNFHESGREGRRHR